jgi:hypothetical protein
LIVDRLTSPLTASGTEIEIPKFASHAKLKKRLMIVESSKQMAFTRTKNKNEVDACDSIRKPPVMYKRI